MIRLLLLSNSTNFGQGFLDHAEAAIRGHLEGVRRLAFVPFALHDRAAYTAKVRSRFAPWGIEVEEVKDGPAGAEGLAGAEAVFVGGGNTFRLLQTLQRAPLLEPLRQRVREGMPYLGASAGTNIAAPTIRTTNDMPIVEPSGFEALGLVPFQINPHYLDPVPGLGHMGETREERIREFLEENDRTVVGLREGSWLRREDGSLRLGGTAAARVFARGREPRDVAPGSSLDDLLPTS